MKSFTRKDWILAAVMLVLVTGLTALLRLDVTYKTETYGYFTLGDPAVYVSAALLGGPLGALVAGIGSALADLFAGHASYAWGSFFIKGLMALLFAWYVRRGHTLMHLIKGVCIGGGTMIVLYFLYDLIIRNDYLYAAIGLPFNLLQALAGGLLSVAVLFFVGGKSYRLGNGFRSEKIGGTPSATKRTLK